MKSWKIVSPSAPHPCEPFGKVRGPKFLPLLLSPTPTPQLTLADRPHIRALYKNSWLRVQVQVNQTPDSSAIKHCCETDNPGDRQPRSISWAAYSGFASCSTPPPPSTPLVINISSHLTQIGGSCHRRTLPCNYSVPALVNTALNHPPWQLASGAPGWLQTSSEEATFSSKSRESASWAGDLCCGLATYTLDCQLCFLCSLNDHGRTGCGHVSCERAPNFIQKCFPPLYSKWNSRIINKLTNGAGANSDFVFSVILCCHIVIASVVSIMLRSS